MRKAFTLIEMMISVVILSIIMLFLYESYASLNRSNIFNEKKVDLITSQQQKKRVVFLDFSLALYKSVKILNQDKGEDVVFMQSSNSLHKRYQPYIAYILKDKKLYRLESLKEFKEYPLAVDSDFTVDFMGKVESFRVYKSTQEGSENYLISINFVQENNILLKVKPLNEE